MNRKELNRIGSKLRINCGGEGGTMGPCPKYGSGGFHQTAVDARAASNDVHEYSDSELSKKAKQLSDATNIDGLGTELAAAHYAASSAHDAAVKELTEKAKNEASMSKRQGIASEASSHQDTANLHEKAGDYFAKSRAKRFTAETTKRLT